MAKLFFVGLDGTEKNYRLQTHRPFTLGRDPGNDIILRDPKVSRHHAEIIFERGFFVVHDLSSANGTYINSRRVRVAPLTHGAKVRMGNTYGRFSEELPTESDGVSAAEPFEQPLPIPTDGQDFLAGLEAVPTSQYDRFSLSTQPHEQLSAEELKKKAE
ncbi:MAG: FHA domain-containing protein [Acidobacteriota bacterium]|nr:FHA domain-containing protein [Acidobacteriota bacterium]